MARQITLPSGQTLTLSPDQDTAVTTVLAALSRPRSEATLAGAAGTGKTTVMNAIVDEWKGGVLFMAPTGKAANRLSEQTGVTVKTIHGSIFKTVEEAAVKNGKREQLLFGEPAPPKGCGSRTLVVVDEASMVNERLAETLREQVFTVGGRILFVGDHEQLPPVDGRWGARLDRPTATLTVVHRQALESAVLELATLIRQGKARTFTRWGEDVRRIHPSTIDRAVEWAEEGRATDALLEFAPEDQREAARVTRVLLTWTNKVRGQANRLTRLGRDYPTGLVVDGETLLCLFNNHDLGRMNGEVVEVSRVEECPELTKCLGTKVQWVIEATDYVDDKGRPQQRETKFLVLPETFDAYRPKKSDRQIYREAWKPLWAKTRPADPTTEESSYQLRERMGWSWEDLRKWRDTMKTYGLQATWGYCLTVHKSQGSQWDEVGFISCPGFRAYDDAEFKRRLTYTAVTRASERFTAFMLAVIPDYRRKQPYGGK
jgi:exodeoxyribonuclease V